jgi:hypothetical protein
VKMANECRERLGVGSRPVVEIIAIDWTSVSIILLVVNSRFAVFTSTISMSTRLFDIEQDARVCTSVTIEIVKTSSLLIIS